jgi:deazaflavin-dependent oxidoreductase (nitroreductase family)
MMDDMGKGIWGRFTSSVPAPRPGTPLWRPWRAVQDLNVRLYRLSGGRIGGRYDRAPVLILHHRGARTNEPRETPLVHLPDGERVVIVASMGGNPRNPAWYHNVRAHPDVEVEVLGRRRPMAARVVDDEAERATLWPRLLEIWPAWEDYRRRTAREFPIVVLEPRQLPLGMKAGSSSCSRKKRTIGST